MNLAGRTALVTGAGGGIGRALAVSLASRRCHVFAELLDFVVAGVPVNAVALRVQPYSSFLDECCGDPRHRQRREHFATATAMYREMQMPHWLEHVEAETRELEQNAASDQ